VLEDNSKTYQNCYYWCGVETMTQLHHYDHHLPLHIESKATITTMSHQQYYYFDGIDIDNIYNNDETTTATTTTTSHRQLTFLDTDDFAYNSSQDNVVTNDEIALVSGFAVMAAGFVLLAFLSARVAWTCQELYEWNAIRLILPAVALVMCFECATMAFDVSKSTVPTQWAIAVYMLEATVAPGIFIFTFVLTFLSYRIRSMPFCFVYRGPSRQAAGEPYQDEDEEVVQPLVRPAVLIVGSRLFSLAVLVLALVVNFDVVWTEEDLAGRTGWATLIQDPSNPSIDHIIMSLLPMALTSITCLYFSLLLWRYGCEFSMVIYPSIINPWMFPVIGTGCMFAGQMFGPDLFPVLSNAGIFLFMASIVRTLYEVRHDIQQSADLGQFLSALGKDRIANTVSGAEKATNGDTASTGRFGGVGSERDGTLSASILGSVRAQPNTTHSSSLHGDNAIDERIDDNDIESVDDVKNKASIQETSQQAEFAAQRVAGIAKRPPKLKDGEKPKMMYVVL
jgi:hypothetical protein